MLWTMDNAAMSNDLALREAALKLGYVRAE